MTTNQGYLLIADLSGYTAYLTSTELDHANKVLASLLEVLVARLGDPLHLWRLEGDAVLAYTTDPDFPSGDTFLTICEGLYNAFAKRRLDIQANTTCPCRACAKVSELDLKILVHHGSFEAMQIGPMRDISGPDVILVHRIAKSDVKMATGVRSYALMTRAAYEQMGEPHGLIEYAQAFDHFDEVEMRVYDLAAAWERHRQKRERRFVAEADGMLTIRVHLPVPPTVAWQLLVSPASKLKWMGLREVNLHAEAGRPEPGAHYHCIHDVAEFNGWVVDWEPFHYLSHRYASCFHPHLFHHETYELTEVEGGSDVRYTTTRLSDPNEPETLQPEADEALHGLYSVAMRGALEALAAAAAEDPARLAR